MSTTESAADASLSAEAALRWWDTHWPCPRNVALADPLRPSQVAYVAEIARDLEADLATIADRIQHMKLLLRQYPALTGLGEAAPWIVALERAQADATAALADAPDAPALSRGRKLHDEDTAMNARWLCEWVYVRTREAATPQQLALAAIALRWEPPCVDADDFSERRKAWSKRAPPDVRRI